MGKTLLYRMRIIFENNKEMPRWLSRIVGEEYMRLRDIAIGLLNPRFEAWNNAYAEEHKNEVVSDDDEYKEYGGFEYCKYIRQKENEILGIVNKRHGRGLISLDTDAYGDISGNINVLFVKIPFYVEWVPIN